MGFPYFLRQLKSRYCITPRCSNVLPRLSTSIFLSYSAAIYYCRFLEIPLHIRHTYSQGHQRDCGVEIQSYCTDYPNDISEMN